MKNLAIAEYFINAAKALLLLSFSKYLYDQTGEIWSITVIFLGELISAAVLPLLVGRKVDQSGIKSVLIIAALSHPLLTWLGAGYAWQVSTSTASILILSVLLSMMWPLMKMSVFVMTPLLTEAKFLEKHNSMLTFAMQAGQFSGMGLAGWLIFNYTYLDVLIAASVIFTLSFIFYCQAAALLPRFSNPGHAQTSANSVMALAKASKPYLLVLMLSQFDFASVAVFNILLAAVVAMLFEGNSYWLAGLDAVYAFGALAGGLIVARGWLKRSCNFKDTVLVQVCFILYLLASFIDSARFLMPVLILCMGLLQSFASIYWRTHLQTELPAQLMGRLAGLRCLISSAYIGVVAALVSYAHQYGFQMAIVVSVIIMSTQTILLIVRSVYARKYFTVQNYQE